MAPAGAVPAIGVAGTAKNTGKTTTLVAMLGAAAGWGLCPAVTSIGYDGEDFDHITGLPKPRVDVAAGTLVATAEQVLHRGALALEPVGRTGVLTPLGEVVVGRAPAAGRVVLAGPATGAGLARVLQALAPLGAGLCLVDGAFGRMAPMLETDGLILATGAARSQDPGALLADAAATAWLFRLAVLAPSPGPAVAAVNLLTAAAGADLAARVAAVAPAAGPLRVELAGAVALAGLETLAAGMTPCPTLEVRAADPVRLVLAGPPTRVRALLRRLGRRGRVGVARPLPLLAITVNPFFPAPVDQGYREAFLDAARLHADFARALPVPVVDVVREGAGGLLALVARAIGRGGPAGRPGQQSKV